MKCPHCNQEHPDNYQYCPETGEKIELFKACNNPSIPEFGKQIVPTDRKNCPSCGQSMEGALPTEPIDILAHLDFQLDEVVKHRLVFIKGNQSLPDFYISETPITQGLWNLITNMKDIIKNTASGRGVYNPMFSVSLQDAEYFIDKLNEYFIEGMRKTIVFKEYTIKKFALPTENQWEYVACEGGKNNLKYSGSDNIDDVAWYKENSDSHIHEVKTKKPNALGVYDMCGNVAEWCQYDSYYGCIARGGSWDDNENACRIDSRKSLSSKNYSASTIGFRIVLLLERR